MKTALFVDFDDSFSYNVVQELTEAGLKVNVINWKDFENVPEEDILVLGPGPGEPDDYERLYPLIRECLSQQKAFFGVCLGHQIFWKLNGFSVTRSANPVHGQKIKLKLNAEWREWLKLPEEVFVQRYNSLAVIAQTGFVPAGMKVLELEGEILMSRGNNIITYQFHPESMGTSFRDAFFAPVLRDLV